MEELSDYVSFESAKLLKKAGYPNKGLSVKHEIPKHGWYAIKYYKNSAQGEWFEGKLAKIDDPYRETADYLHYQGILIAAPFIWDAMKWLREEKDVRIGIDFCLDSNPVIKEKFSALVRWKEKGEWLYSWLFKDSFEAVADYAIQYGLKKIFGKEE